MQIVIKPFDALTLSELHACLKLRGEVFVVGQQTYQIADVDEHDPLCHHVLMRVGDKLVGTARLLPIGDVSAIKVGRVAVSADWRGRGLGCELMRAVQAWIDQRQEPIGIMHAQLHLVDWYTALGWRRVGEPFLEAGIEHIKMRYTPENAA